MNKAATQQDATTESPKYWSGSDVSKEVFDAALWLPGQSKEVEDMKRMPTEQFERSPEGVRAFLAWCDRHGYGTPRVVMEATGSYSIELAAWMLMERPELAPAIVNGHKTSKYIESLDMRTVNDRKAARALARFGFERTPAPYEPPTPMRKQLRDLTRYRRMLVEDIKAKKQRLDESGADSPFVRRDMQSLIKLLERRRKKTEKEIREMISKMPSVKADVELLSTIRGVALITAATVVAELGDLRRFKCARELTSFSGMSVRVRDSGKTVRKRPRMTKMGPADVRRVLHMAALTAVGGDNEWARMYQRLVDAGKPKLVALGAIMRKILCTMRAMLISGKPYDSNYRGACG